MSIDGPGSDRGLQNERTALAWTRTGLALLVCAVTMAKLTLHASPIAALVWLLLGAGGAAVMLLGSRRLYRARRRADVLPPPGAAIGLATSVIVIGGLAAAASILAGHL